MKKVYQSKTIWKAVIIGLSGVAVAVLTELDLVGYAMVLNSLVDMLLRVVTSEPLE